MCMLARGIFILHREQGIENQVPAGPSTWFAFMLNDPPLDFLFVDKNRSPVPVLGVSERDSKRSVIVQPHQERVLSSWYLMPANLLACHRSELFPEITGQHLDSFWPEVITLEKPLITKIQKPKYFWPKWLQWKRSVTREPKEYFHCHSIHVWSVLLHSGAVKG